MKGFSFKILSFVFILALMLNLAACSEKKVTKTPKTEVADEVSTTIETPKENEDDKQVDNDTEKATEAEDTEKPHKKDEEKDMKKDTEKDTESEPVDPEKAKAKVLTFIENNKSDLESKFREEFFAKTGRECVCTVSASDTRVVFTCNLTGFNDLADADKSKLKILAASMRNTANYALSIITEAEPEVTGADFNVCEEDGDPITTISVNK